MNYREEVREVKRRLFLSFFLLIAVACLLCGVGVSYINFGGVQVPVPSVSSQTLVSLFFVRAKLDLLPPEIVVISTSPITVFLMKIKIALLGSLVINLPYLLFSFVRYLSPALLPKERRRLRYMVVASTGLCFLGMFFAYHFLVRSMFAILFSFNFDSAVTQYLAIDEFVSWTLAALGITGLLFLLPIFMYMLTIFRIAKSRFWIAKWREASILFLVIASIITPDVSGVSVLLLSVPMASLYAIGIGLSLFYERRHKVRR
jgi:sec-independent protein translocase protein TatC